MKNTEKNLIQTNIPLATKNWFETGGPAAYYAEPTNIGELQDVVAWAQKNKQKIHLLGKGANMLISDAVINGLVIRPNLKHITYKNNDHETVRVTAGAGVEIDELITACLERNIIGFEEFSAIPGTIGGAVFINIHYFAASLADFLVSATLLDLTNSKLITVEKDWFNFGYDYSKIHKSPYIIVEATFAFKQGSALEGAFARGRAAEITRHRKQRYPYKGTCGSFFKNFSAEEVTITSNGRKAIWVAYYLDKLGIKGDLCVGGACVSHQHANMIVNQGNASSQDIINLARTMQQKVYDAFGLIPEAECQFLGFADYPLLQKSN